MWVRTSNRDALYRITGFLAKKVGTSTFTKSIYGHTPGSVEPVCLGVYATENRTMEILDEIYHFLDKHITDKIPFQMPSH